MDPMVWVGKWIDTWRVCREKCSDEECKHDCDEKYGVIAVLEHDSANGVYTDMLLNLRDLHSYISSISPIETFDYIPDEYVIIIGKRGTLLLKRGI